MVTGPFVWTGGLILRASVGSGGHVLHGGYGVSSHYKGLALDWLVGMKVVLANSSVVTLSDTEHPDLYWAMKGAGSSFGIAVEFYFNTFEPPAVLTTFTSQLSWPNETVAAAGLKTVQEFASNSMPAEITARLFITKQGVNLEGLYYGDKAGLQAALDPLMKGLNAKIRVATPGNWLSQLSYFSMGVSLDQTETYPMVGSGLQQMVTKRELTTGRPSNKTTFIHPACTQTSSQTTRSRRLQSTGSARPRHSSATGTFKSTSTAARPLQSPTNR
jgi:hypothetical protein